MARILLAESDRRIRAFLAGLLADFGHDVVACADSAEADARLALRPVDLVVTDLVLSEEPHPGFIGDCAARGIPTVTLTGCEFRGGEPAERRPLPLLEKPFRIADLREFLAAVAVHAAGGAPARQNGSGRPPRPAPVSV